MSMIDDDRREHRCDQISTILEDASPFMAIIVCCSLPASSFVARP
jgi:hypothetical protein